jgi:hypothetical protein
LFPREFDPRVANGKFDITLGVHRAAYDPALISIKITCRRARQQSVARCFLQSASKGNSDSFIDWQTGAHKIRRITSIEETLAYADNVLQFLVALCEACNHR